MTRIKAVIIQRFYPNYREGLFDRLGNEGIKLICHRKSYGKIICPSGIENKKYIHKAHSFRVFGDIVVFPFLLFNLISLRPSVIISEGGKNTINNVIVYLYSKLFNVPYIIWDLGKMYMGNLQNSSYKDLYYNLQYFLLEKAYKIFTYNQVNIPYFEQILKRKKAIIALGNTIDTDKIEKLKQQKQIKPNDITQKILKRKNVFLYIGALNEKKKVCKLSQILKDETDFGLIIIGEGDTAYKEKLTKAFKGLNYVMVGYKSLDQLPYYYKISDLVILPGLGGLTIPQSYMFETPVLCTNADGTEKEIIKNYVNGFVYKNLEEARGFLRTVTKEQLKSMGEEGYVLVKKKYSIENYANSIINALK